MIKKSNTWPRSSWFAAVLLGLCLFAATPLAAQRGFPAVTRTDGALQVVYPTTQGTVYGIGQIQGPGLRMSVHLGGQPLTFEFVTTGSGGASVDYGPYGGLQFFLDDATGEPRLHSSTLDGCSSLLQEPLYQALLEIHGNHQNLALAGDQAEILNDIANVFLMAVGLVDQCAAFHTGGAGDYGECIRKWRDCNGECEKEYCEDDGCSALGLGSCYTVCDLGRISCGICSVLCPWTSTLETVM